MEVYLLWYTCRDPRLREEAEMLIGVYSSTEKAAEAKARLSEVKGFKDDLSGFEICPYLIDEDNWTKGFTIA